MDACGQPMNGGYGLAVWLTQWRRARESESKTFLWSTLRGRYTRNEFETSVDVVVTPPPQGVGGKPMRRRANGPSFMAEFKRGIRARPFGQQCMEAIDCAERVQFVS